MSESNSIPKKLPIKEQLNLNPAYSTKLYIVTGTTLLTSLFIILSQLYAFPGSKSSFLTFTFPNTTYKIYPFRYCVAGSQDDEYSANGNRCHLSSNPLSYILTTNKLPTPPKDIQLFHTLTSLSSLIYYLSLHLNLLLLYLFWRRIMQPPILPLWAACLTQTLTLLLPASLLTLLAQTLSQTPPAKPGTTYLFLLHTIWLIHFLAFATLLTQQYIRERRRRLISELDDLNTEAPVRAPSARAVSGSHEMSGHGSGNVRGAPPPPPASSGYHHHAYGPGVKGNDN